MLIFNQLGSSRRQKLYVVLSYLVPLVLTSAVIELFTRHFIGAWLCAFCAVLLIEARVQMGGRVAHTRWFWTHLFFSVSFFALLTLLAFGATSLWILYACWCSIVVALATGARLWTIGLRNMRQNK